MTSRRRLFTWGSLALALAAIVWSQRGPWLNPGRWDEPPDEWRGWRAP